MTKIVSLAKENFMDILNSDKYFAYTKEDYDEYLEWKSTLSDSELRILTFSWYIKHRVQLKQYYEQINDWRKLKPNQFLKKTNVERIDYNEWNW